MSFVFDRSFAQTNVEAENWEDAVRAAGYLLLENGAVEKRFVDAMVETVKRNGPYIVISKGLAIPHARPEDGAKKVAISVITLKNPVPFEHKKNDPVKLVIALSSIDNKSHTELLAHIAKILSDKKKTEALKKKKNEKDIIKIIRKVV